jgi:hypothetical protein
MPIKGKMPFNCLVRLGSLHAGKEDVKGVLLHAG